MTPMMEHLAEVALIGIGQGIALIVVIAPVWWFVRIWRNNR